MSEFSKVKNIVDKTIEDHPLKPIWNLYNRGKLIDKLGHYKAICQACNRLFLPGKPAQMEKHIIDECTNFQKNKKKLLYILLNCANQILLELNLQLNNYV
ncbi:3332_t:CDS:1 [Gigaspora rosea]|nr:3332_t:CDS:1 [Gigaspora rosea]